MSFMWLNVSVDSQFVTISTWNKSTADICTSTQESQALFTLNNELALMHTKNKLHEKKSMKKGIEMIRLRKDRTDVIHHVLAHFM